MSRLYLVFDHQKDPGIDKKLMGKKQKKRTSAKKYKDPKKMQNADEIPRFFRCTRTYEHGSAAKSTVTHFAGKGREEGALEGGLCWFGQAGCSCSWQY